MPLPQDDHNRQYLNYSGLQDPDGLVSFIGSNDGLPNGTFETVWPEGGIYVYPSALTTMTISSADANDANPSGSGLRTVLVHGLDTDFNNVREVVALNGQTGVTLTNQFYRILRLIGLSAGATGSNEGKVYVGEGSITAGVPATIYDVVEIGINISHSGLYTIQYGMSAYLVNAIFTGETNKTTEYQVVSRLDGGLLLAVGEFFVQSAPIVLNRIVPFRKIPSGTDIQVRAQGIGATSLAKAMVTLALIPDP